MTRQEQIKFCSICKKQKIDFEKGIICGLTQNTATFENSCENFEPDLTEIKNRTGKDVDLSGIAKNDIPNYVDSMREKESVATNTLGGWTSFFIFTIFLSLAFKIYMTIKSLHEFDGIGFIPGISNLKTFLILYLVVFCILGVYTAFCLIKKKPNAVAVMRTFLIIALIECVSTIIFASTNSDMYDKKDMKSVFQSIVYCVVWLAFSIQSQNLETLFPKDKRTWRIPEKIMGIVSIILCILIFISLGKAIKSAEKIANGDFTELSGSGDSSARHLLEVGISEIEHPYKVDNDMTCTEESLVGDVYTSKIIFDDVSYSDFKEYDIKEMEQMTKDGILGNLNSQSSDESIYVICAKENITVKYEYYSSDDKLIYTVTLTPEDVKSKIK